MSENGTQNKNEEMPELFGFHIEMDVARPIGQAAEIVANLLRCPGQVYTGSLAHQELRQTTPPEVWRLLGFGARPSLTPEQEKARLLAEIPRLQQMAQRFPLSDQKWARQRLAAIYQRLLELEGELEAPVLTPVECPDYSGAYLGLFRMA